MGCKRKANAASGLLPLQPHGAADKILIFGVTRWGKTAGVLPLRFAPEKSAFCPTAVIMRLNQRFLRLESKIINQPHAPKFYGNQCSCENAFLKSFQRLQGFSVHDFRIIDHGTRDGCEVFEQSATEF